MLCTLISLQLIKSKNSPISDKKHIVHNLWQTARQFTQKGLSYANFTQELGLNRSCFAILAILELYDHQNTSAILTNLESYFRYNYKSNGQISQIYKLLKYLDGSTSSNFVLKNEYSDMLLKLKTPEIKAYTEVSDFMEEVLSKQSDTFNDVVDKLLRKDDQRQIYDTIHQFNNILIHIETVALFFLHENNLQDAFNFIQDYIEFINSLSLLSKLLKYSPSFVNIQAKLYHISLIHCEILIRMLIKGSLKSPDSMHQLLNQQLIRICQYYHIQDHLLNPLYIDITKEFRHENYQYHILKGIISIRMGVISRAKVEFYHALRGNPEKLICRKWIAWFNSIYQRKKMFFEELSEVIHADFKVKRDQHTFDSCKFEIDCNFSGLSMVEYVGKINKSDNKLKAASKLALYLDSIDSWYLFCTYYVAETKPFQLRNIEYVLDVLYLKVIRRINQTICEDMKVCYEKLLKNAIKLAIELKLQANEKSIIVNNLMKEIERVEKALLKGKLDQYKAKLQVVYHPRDIRKLKLNEFETLRILSV